MRDWLVNLPEELTESDLIDMVEGTLPPARESVAIAALKAEPRLGLLIKQMRIDKAALAGEPSGRAPADLGERVMGTLEAHTLREIAARDQERAAGIPVSTFEMHDEPIAGRVVVESRMFRVFATAATIALFGGLTAYIAREVMNYKPMAVLPTPIAAGPQPVETASGDDLAAAPGADGRPIASRSEASAPSANAVQSLSGAIASSSSASEPGALAPRGAADSAPAGSGPGEAAMSISVSRAKAGSKPATTANLDEGVALASKDAPAQAGSSRVPTISASLAAGLVREGRLGITLRPRDVGTTVKRLDALVRIGAQSPTQGQRELVFASVNLKSPPASLAALTVPSDAVDAVGRSGGEAAEPPALLAQAGADTRERSARLGSTAPALTPSRAVVKALYTVEVEASERGLADLARIVGEADGRTVVYRALGTPIEPAVSFEPEAVLWWTGSAARWGKPAIVPIIVETRE